MVEIPDEVGNYMDGKWQTVAAAETVPFRNPATGEATAATPLSPPQAVDRVIQAAARAFPEWRWTRPLSRFNPFFA